MAEDKKSFVAYADWQSQFNLLSDDEAGRLIKHLFSYVNDENPEFSASDRLLIMAFEPIKNQLKRDLKKYETIKKRRSDAGKKSAELRSKSVEQELTKSTSVEFVKQESTNPTVNVTDTVNGNGNVNVNVNGTDTVTDNDFKGLLGAEAQKKSKADFEKDKTPKKPDREEKEKSSAEKEKFGKPEFRKALIDAGVEEQHADDWIKVRTAKRASFTLTVLESLFNECEKNNFQIKDAVRICAEQSWQGFKFSWVKNLENNGKQTGITASQGRQQRVDEVEQFRVDNQKSLASRLQKHITGNTEQPAVNSEN